MKKLAWLLLVGTCMGQEPTKKVPTFDAVDVGLIANLSAANALDGLTTSQCVNSSPVTRNGFTSFQPPCHEVILPHALVESSGRIAGTMAVKTIAEIALQYELEKHGHRKIARITSAILGGSTELQALKNHQITKQ